MRGSWIIDPDTGDLVDAREYWTKKARKRSRCRTGSPVIVTDWRPDQAVVSPVDGSLLTSRADVRLHNERNDCVSVGNDMRGRMSPPEPEIEGVEEILAGVARGDIQPEPAEKGTGKEWGEWINRP